MTLEQLYDLYTLYIIRIEHYNTVHKMRTPAISIVPFDAWRRFNDSLSESK